MDTVMSSIISLHMVRHLYSLPLNVLSSSSSSSSPGGDVNVKDNEGDTPLYTVEECETAKYLIHHGAIVDMKNLEGISVNFSSLGCNYIHHPDSRRHITRLSPQITLKKTFPKWPLTSVLSHPFQTTTIQHPWPLPPPLPHQLVPLHLSTHKMSPQRHSRTPSSPRRPRLPSAADQRTRSASPSSRLYFRCA
jgi:hypothetical protein